MRTHELKDIAERSLELLINRNLEASDMAYDFEGELEVVLTVRRGSNRRIEMRSLSVRAPQHVEKEAAA